LKKQKAKKAGGGKKKEKTEAAAEAAAEASTEASTEAPAEPEAEAPNTAVEAEEKPEEAAPEAAEEAAEEATPASPGPVDDDESSELPALRPAHGRKPSMAVESRQRSESFYRSGAPGAPTSPTGLTPVGGVSSEIYREQVQRIEELEKENSRLTGEVDEYKGKWSKGEEELEEFREGRGDVAIAIEKGKQADKLVWSRTPELAPVQS
jgi:hypothetical protein